MTAILGLKKVINGKPSVIVGSDSLFVAGWKRINAKDRSKLIAFPDFIVGFSGICTIQRVLYDIQKDAKLLKQPMFKMSGEEDALAFGTLVFSEVKSRLEEMGESFSDSVGNLVIATPTKLFEVDRFAFSIECEEYATSGCVDDFLSGYLAAKYSGVDTDQDLVDLLYESLEAAVKHSTGVHPPIIMKRPVKSTKSYKNKSKSKKVKKDKSSAI